MAAFLPGTWHTIACTWLSLHVVQGSCSCGCKIQAKSLPKAGPAHLEMRGEPSEAAHHGWRSEGGLGGVVGGW